MVMKSFAIRHICFLVLAVAIMTITPQGVCAADDGRKTIRGEMSAGGTASGFTSINASNGEFLQVPNMSQAAQKIQENCGRDEECEVVYTIDKKKQVKVHSAKPVGR